MAKNNRQIQRQDAPSQEIVWSVAFDSITDMVAVIDKDRRIVGANKAMREAFPEVANSQPHCYRLMHGCDALPDHCISSQSFASGKKVTAEIQEPHLDNRWYSVDAFPIKDTDGAIHSIVHVFRDITERKQNEQSQQLMSNILELMNRPEADTDIITDILHEIKKQTGLEAVGIRLKDGDDYPYYVAEGFSDTFVEKERHLCPQNEDGEVLRDTDGNPVLECMCGNIICGRTSPSLPFFTEGGSFWSNCTTELPASTTEEDRQARTRNRCNGEGYESVALIPLRYEDSIIGLLQLNDRRKNQFTPAMIASFEHLAKTISIAFANKDNAETLRKSMSSLQASEIRYRRLFESAKDGILILDADSGKIVDVNPFLIDLLGYTHAEFVGKQLWEIGMFKDVVANKDAFTELIDKSYVRFENLPLETKDGRQVDVEFVSNVYLVESSRVVQCNIRDVTERKRAEEAIRQIARFPEENPNPVLRVSSDGTILYANEASSCLLADWEVESGEKLPAEVFSMVSLVHTSGERQTQEVSGMGRLYSFEVTPVKGESYVNLYAQDITEHRQMEEQLRQSEKLQAIGQLAGGIAHDFNNQLSPVVGYADMLVNRLEDDTLRRYATNIKMAAKRAAELTAQLLAFSRKGKNLSVPVEIHKVLAEVTSILEHTIDKRIQIRETLNASPATTMGDPNQLQNAILNMALNARDAMPKGGKLIFETSITRLDEQFCKGHPYELTPGTYLKISITDNGCGMDAETQKRLFEPFYTTKEVGKGTGMGLASVYGTIRNHKGAISVYSEVGHGSTFRIYLPLAEDARKEQKADGRSEPITGTAHILLVDDEEMVRELAADMLRELGYEVTLCKDGKEAVEYYEKSWEETDLVLLDMVMPEIGGLDTFIIMRNINPKIRSLLLSGYSLTNEVQEILDEGVLGFLQKPFEQVELSEKVAQILRGGVAIQ